MDGAFVPFGQFEQDSEFPHKTSESVLMDTGAGFLRTLRSGSNRITIDVTDPENPIINYSPYSLPQATDMILGGIKLGSGLVLNGVSGRVDVTGKTTPTDVANAINTALAAYTNTTALDAALVATLGSANGYTNGAIATRAPLAGSSSNPFATAALGVTGDLTVVGNGSVSGTLTVGSIALAGGGSTLPGTILPDGTTTQKGINELATIAEALTGTDNTRTITAYVLNNLGKSLGATGYLVLPGGLTIQWGTATGSSGSVSFPVTYGTACYGVLRGDLSTWAAVGFNTITTTGFNFACHSAPTGDAASKSFFWLAVGK